MSSSIHNLNNVGVILGKSNKFEAPRGARQDASLMFSSELSEGASCHMKPRKVRADGRYSSIGDGLESSISNEAKGKIDRLLGEIKHLSDVEKFVLYLKLPTGETPSEDLRRTPTPYSKQGNRVEQSLAYIWIKSHLEEDNEICLPKQEVYDEYKQYCDNHSLVPLCNADFGKLMKTVFPSVKPRRLGQRGQSRYCYGGLRKKLDVEAPSLPEIEVSVPQEKDEKTEDNHLYIASCDLVLEWAVKLLEQNFSGMRELAEYLVSNLFVNSKSVSAFTVIAAMEEAGVQKVSSMFSNSTGGDRHRETQLQLQRKLHEREHVSRQKKKLQQMKEDNVTRQKQDRQTPLIMSPTAQQDLMSPRKIFEESEDAEMRTHTGRSSIQDGVRPQRHRSVSSTRKKRTKSVTPQEALDKGGGTSSGEEISIQSSQAVAVPKEDQMIVEQGVVNSGMSVVTDSGTGSTVEMMTVEDLIHSEKWRGERWKMEGGTREEMEMTEGALKLNDNRREKSVLVHAQTLEQTIPQLSSAGSAALSESKPLIVQAPSHHQPSEGSSLSSLLNSNRDLGVIPSVVIAAEDVPQNKDTTDSKSRFLSTASISVPINILPTLSSSTPTVSSSSSFTQLSYLQKEPQCITNTTVSNRSAFVPFSQFTRKDNSGDGPELLLEPDDNPCLSEKAQTFLISENGKQIIIMTSKSNMLNLPSNVDPTDSQIQLVPAATASSNHPSAPVKTTTTPAQVEPQSPTTPKKNRSRFTPIRPKGSPAKTVSSILKEQKLPEKPDSEKIDRSKSVSTLLKEKREREAKLQITVSTAAVVPTPGVASVGGLATIPATKLPLQTPESPHGEYFIILNPVAPGLNTPMVSMTSESVTSVTTTLTTVSSHGAVPECSSSTVDLYLRRERSRTASLSEGDITSPSNVDNLNMSDLSDSSDEKPSKLAKIVDSDQNVSSRPGSRCSVDRETPSILGRKRKLFSSQSVEGGNYIERHPTRVPSNDDDADFTMEEDRRAVSCSLERCSQRDVSRVFDDKLKLAEKRNYPDISVLESDALQDACIPDPSNFILKGKELIKQKQDTGVGVTSLSLRKSQQRLLKEKPILDERMKSFFQQNDSVLGGKTSEPPEDSELPPDVAEFITDSMTQAHLGEQMEISSTMHPTTTRSLSRQEVVQEICKNLQNIPCDPSVLPSAKSPVCPQRSHSAKNLPPSAGVRTGRMSLDEDTFRMPYRSQSVTDASRALLDIRVPTPDKIPIQPSQSVKDGSHQTTKKTTGGVEFASPQRPIRRQRTPSTENPRKRESSVERSLSQTPHSDPGYGSVGPSPILPSVLVSTGTHVCDSTYSSMSSTSLSVCRPDSAHSVTSDGNIPSPMASPRFQTSTPYHLKSPCVTPSQAPVSSEALPVQSFMPIQGSSRKIDNSFVTLIRPVVTIASQISQNATAGQVFVNEAMDEAKAKSTKQAPPSYTAAMQDMERKSKKESKQGAFKTLEAPLLNLSDNNPLPGPPLNETMSGHSFYFSDKLAQLSKKTHTSDSETVPNKTSRRDQSIKIIMGQLTSPIDPLHQGQSNIQSLSELPDANYQGNQPNVNMFDIEGIVTYKNSLVTEVSGISESEEEKQQGFHEQGQFSARRNLSEILGQNFTGDDLQATLDDLKAVDSQYFVDNFDLGSEKRQEI